MRVNRCVNCYYLIPKNMHKHPTALASTSIINLLQAWINPTQLSSESILCNECLKLLEYQVNTLSWQQGNAVPFPALGHRRICFPCGHSLLRKSRTYPVQRDCPERDYLLKLLPSHLVSKMEHVCAACWRAATREVQRQQKCDSNRSTSVDLSVSEYSGTPDPLALPTQVTQPERQVTPKIKSSLYRRAANTPGHCIFVKCLKPERLLIPSAIKNLVLYQHKFYIPSGARVCRHHLDQGSWHELTSKLNDFTGRQFDIIMSMMRQATNCQFDFSNIMMMPPHLCHYWLGRTSDQFYALLNCIPTLAEQVPNASIALCMLIVKLRTGESNERLATLFNKPRATLERWMNKARCCLMNSSVPSNLGLNFISVHEKKNQAGKSLGCRLSE